MKGKEFKDWEKISILYIIWEIIGYLKIIIDIDWLTRREYNFYNY